MKRCERCRTGYQERCPVCEGSAEEWASHIESFYDLSFPTEKRELASDIAARDAAMKAEGRREGLEEAIGCVVMCQENCNCSDRTINAIRAAMEEA